MSKWLIIQQYGASHFTLSALSATNTSTSARRMIFGWMRVLDAVSMARQQRQGLKLSARNVGTNLKLISSIETGGEA
ncbi:hypothetical protein BS412_15770 [Cronobacter turicensis]|uniref:Uncharacterized protein n=1 Tax=Cronobacter turicensis TaxID=413502 RepID=A0A2T7B4Q8_9ENTR|nr:hypothetical protein BS411_10775 [Cronobacter turicensis]PUX32372.1 hypothetical protein BS412_15770 [Cronobacter turicensis]